MAAKVQIKNEKYMPYGGIYFVIREFLLKMAPIIDGYLGLRSKLIGYQYSEISLAMLCNFCCGGDRTEDIYRVHDMIEQKPGLRICSPDTVLRALAELSVEDRERQGVPLQHGRAPERPAGVCRRHERDAAPRR